MPAYRYMSFGAGLMFERCSLSGTPKELCFQNAAGCGVGGCDSGTSSGSSPAPAPVLAPVSYPSGLCPTGTTANDTVTYDGTNTQ